MATPTTREAVILNSRRACACRRCHLGRPDTRTDTQDPAATNKTNKCQCLAGKRQSVTFLIINVNCLRPASLDRELRHFVAAWRQLTGLRTPTRLVGGQYLLIKCHWSVKLMSQTDEIRQKISAESEPSWRPFPLRKDLFCSRGAPFVCRLATRTFRE